MDKQLDKKRSLLYSLCQQAIALKIHHAEQSIQHAREAAKDDTKSSAGDKHETTREMMQQEISRNERQMVEAKKLKFQFESITIPIDATIVQQGSLVETTGGTFFIAVALGAFQLDEDTCFVISPASPLGQLIIGKRKNDLVEYNKKTYRILQIG